MARHRHNWQFIRSNPPVPQMGGSIAKGATLWRCTGCPAEEIRPGPRGMQLVAAGAQGDPGPVGDQILVPGPAPAPPKGWLGSNISVAIGYTAPNGVNDVAVITPKAGLNRQQLRAEAQAAWTNIQNAGTPVWVDGQPDTLVQDVAAALNLSVGWPDGWLLDPNYPVVVNSG